MKAASHKRPLRRLLVLLVSYSASNSACVKVILPRKGVTEKNVPSQLFTDATKLQCETSVGFSANYRQMFAVEIYFRPLQIPQLIFSLSIYILVLYSKRVL